jgi:hypothetical protein
VEFVGHVNGIEKYVHVSWKVCMWLSNMSIDDGSVWWLCMGGIVGGACLTRLNMMFSVRYTEYKRIH